MVMINPFKDVEDIQRKLEAQLDRLWEPISTDQLCPICEKPLEDDRYEYMGETYHKACLIQEAKDSFEFAKEIITEELFEDEDYTKQVAVDWLEG